MFRLHYAPDNTSLIVRLALDEMGLPFETALVDRGAKAQKSAAYRAINPRGLIPALETPHGAMFETGAILLYLSETTGRLAPPPGDPARAAFLSWLFALSSGLHASLRALFYPAAHAGPDRAAIAANFALTKAQVRDELDLWEALAGAGESWFGAPEPSVLDLYLGALLRWLALYPVDHAGWFRLADWPNLAALAGRLEARPSVQRAAAAEGLGAAPLTNPAYATPPEGTAT